MANIKAFLKKVFSKKISSNIFAKYFILFATILLVVLTVLGTALTALVNTYWKSEKTQMLEENTHSVASTVESMLVSTDMNSSYSVEKEMICSTLNVISNSIDGDIFVCDVEGNVILCKDKAGSHPNIFGTFSGCKTHDNLTISSGLLQRVYQSDVVDRTTIDGKNYYVVGCSIKSNGAIIGSVFSLIETGTSSLVLAVSKIFIFSALACLILAFICTYFLTKRMISPIRQMSKAANQFAVGNFSYRVKIESSDELADLGNAFNEMADALDKLESSRRSFVANVSHELKTPMTSISGFIDGILDGTIPPEKSEYYLNIVSDEVRRLSRLVVAMLNMSKIESGDFKMNILSYDISDQIISILLNFEQKIDNKNIEIIGLDKLIPTVIKADPDMIYQAVYNIVDNAVKFTNENGFIEVQMEDLDNAIKITIRNSGEGIKSDEISRIFERFYKVDKSRSLDAKGAGLGLYIVKMIIEMHGGRIKAQSDNSTVAEFIITLPKESKPLIKENNNGRLQQG